MGSYGGGEAGGVDIIEIGVSYPNVPNGLSSSIDALRSMIFVGIALVSWLELDLSSKFSSSSPP